MKIRYFLFFLLLIAGSYLHAQVTTSGMNGKVTSSSESLPGATVMVVHVPSGTQYGTITDPNGYYHISNMRIGGPYTLKVSYVGYKTAEITDIILNLGQTHGVNVTLTQESSQISGVVVVAVKNSLMDGNRTGASTNVGSQQIQTMPTISRSINDFIIMINNESILIV